MDQTLPGIDTLINNPPKYLHENRIGLLCNPASINQNLNHSRDVIHRNFPGQLTALFSPQHGFFAEKQDNMIESEDIYDTVLHIPVFSLYGTTRMPTKEMFDHIDILLIDLQDVGTRVYTFIYTMSHCLEAAKKFGKKVIILDRPNPINGITTEGNCLVPSCSSFVGRYPIPMRHGLTIGELALLFNEHFNIECNLEVIPITGWDRKMYFKDTGLVWIPPSPNLPTPTSAMVYPGQVIWEGTNISEGRGTTQPFEVFGAPFLNPEKIISFIGDNPFPGIFLRPVSFEPTSNKWARQVCKGFQIHVTAPDMYHSYCVSLKLLQAIIHFHGNTFEWKNPPYEYEYERSPIDLIIGDSEVRKRIENLEDINTIQLSWEDGLNSFLEISKKFHIYT